MNKMFVIIFSISILLTGCGGFFDNLGGNGDIGDVSDASPVVLDCDLICSRFMVFDCVSVIMQALPVGRTIKSTECVDRCEEFSSIYKELNEQLDIGCLGSSSSCSDVASCFGIK